jgi:hypothetical protein
MFTEILAGTLGLLTVASLFILRALNRQWDPSHSESFWDANLIWPRTYSLMRARGRVWLFWTVFCLWSAMWLAGLFLWLTDLHHA